jgi:hypothetical protein
MTTRSTLAMARVVYGAAVGVTEAEFVEQRGARRYSADKPWRKLARHRLKVLPQPVAP